MLSDIFLTPSRHLLGSFLEPFWKIGCVCEHVWPSSNLWQAKEEASRKEAQAVHTRQVAEREEVERRRRREWEEGAKKAEEGEAAKQRSAGVKEEECEGHKEGDGEGWGEGAEKGPKAESMLQDMMMQGLDFMV